MTLKANLVLFLVLAGVAAAAQGQGTNTQPLPSAPRADGTGPSTPSLSSGGEAELPAQARADLPQKAGDKEPTPAELNAAVREAHREPVKPLEEQPERLPLVKNARAPSPSSSRRAEPTLTQSVTGPINPVSTGLNSTDLARQIRELTFVSRDGFLNDLQTRIENSERDFKEVERSSFALKGDARATYRRAFKDVKTTRKTLWSTLRDARTAPSQAWPEMRNRLATAYEGYAITLTRAEASSSIGH